MIKCYCKHKKIPGHENYIVSECGHVYSLKTTGVKIMSKTPDKDGYFKTKMNGINVKNHRIVASAFLGSIKNKVVMHLDNNPQNNHVSNLKIGTQLENVRQMIRDGRNAGGKNWKKSMSQKN